MTDKLLSQYLELRGILYHLGDDDNTISTWISSEKKEMLRLQIHSCIYPTTLKAIMRRFPNTYIYAGYDETELVIKK